MIEKKIFLRWSLFFGIGMVLYWIICGLFFGSIPGIKSLLGITIPFEISRLWDCLIGFVVGYIVLQIYKKGFDSEEFMLTSLGILIGILAVVIFLKLTSIPEIPDESISKPTESIIILSLVTMVSAIIAFTGFIGWVLIKQIEKKEYKYIFLFYLSLASTVSFFFGITQYIIVGFWLITISAIGICVYFLGMLIFKIGTIIWNWLMAKDS